MPIDYDVPGQVNEDTRSFRSVPCLLIAFLLTALILLPFFALLVYEVYFMHRIHVGVSVGGVELSGLTLAEAEKKLSSEFEDYAEREVTLRYGDRIWFASSHELGVTHDARLTSEVAYRVGREGSVLESLRMQIDALAYGYPVRAIQGFDEGVATMYLSKLATLINQPVRDAKLKVDGFRVLEESGQVGRELDIPVTKAGLRAALANLSDEPVDVVVRTLQPSVMDVDTARQQVENILSQPLFFTLREQTFISDTTTAQVVEKRWMLDRAALADVIVTRQVKNADGSVSLNVGLDMAQLTPYFEKLAEQINRPARDARLDFDPETGQLKPLIVSQEGYVLDVASTVALADAQAVTEDHVIPLPVEVIRPDVAVENIPQLGIKELVSEATTYFKGSSAARMRNIQVAASRFEGVVIAPGEIFSFNEYLGDVSTATGYEESLIIWGDRTAIGIGGGVCQVSTTVFRAAFWAGLPILERYNHGYRVSWYEPPVGMDATVYAPAVDLKFKNDMASYLLIKVATDLEAATVTFRFYGTDQGRVVELDGPVESNDVPHGAPVYQDDASLPLGTEKQVEWAHDGVDVTIFRTVSEGGQVILRDQFFSRYSPWVALYLRGTKGSAAAGVNSQ
jgi:vancomycin resistance protein YoaR